MHPSSTRCALLLAAAVALAGGARAAPVPNSAAPPAQPAQSAPDAVSAPAAAAELLESTRGGSAHTTVSSTLTGTIEGNTATNVSTGANVIQGGAFANMAGIPLVVQNTGANVLIQNATTINLQLK